MTKKYKKRKKKIEKKGKKEKKEIKKPIKPENDSKTERIKKTRIMVIGIGGGGGTIVSEISNKMRKATFVAANTDSQALKTLGRKVVKFQFGQALTKGLGTGMNVELGEEAAKNDKEKIKKLLTDQDICILVTCLGGGAGTGALPVFARISGNLGILTYGIFTLPFNFEGEKKLEIAEQAVKKTRNYLNVLSIIPNDRVFRIINKSTPLKQSLSVINKSLSESLESLIETIYEPGLINIDFADVKTILEGRGKLGYLNTFEIVKKDGSTKELVDRILNSYLYPYGIKGAKSVLLNITSEKNLSLAEVNEISKAIAETVSPEAKIILGISQSSKYDGLVKTTLLAAGCQMKIFTTKEEPRVKEIIKEEVKEQEEIKKIKKDKKNKDLNDSQKEDKSKKKKIKVVKIKKEEPIVETLQEETLIPREEIGPWGKKTEEAIRKSALQVKKESEEEEKQILEKEKFWEVPAFLRRRFTKRK